MQNKFVSKTKTYFATKKAMTKEDFIKSDYDYGIGAYIHLYEDPEDPDVFSQQKIH